MPTTKPTPGSPASDAPPPVKRGPGRPIAIIAATVIVAGLLLLVVMNIDRSEGPRGAPTAGDVPELDSPGALTAEELSGDAAADFTQPSGGGLPQGGLIQFADPDDPQRLAQRCRFQSLDPNPDGRGPGWLELTDPDIEIYLADDRMLSITGDTALISAPNDALEEGVITGDVAIRLFETRDGRAIDANRDRPTFIVQTGEAQFDNLLGEVRCEDRILVETAAMEFPGENLRMQINDLDEWVTLRIETVDHIRLASHPASTENQRGDLTQSGTGRGRAQDDDTAIEGDAAQSAGAGTNRGRAKAPSSPSSTSPPTDDESDDAQYYRLTLSDNIRIVQGDDLTGRLITGDRIDVIFSAEGGGLNLEIASSIAPPKRANAQQGKRIGSAGTPRPLPVAISRLVLASMSQDEQLRRRLAPPPADGDAYIYCDGPLTVDPIRQPVASLPAAGDTLLELIGRPVKLLDREAATNAQCASVRYRTTTQTTELIGSQDYPLFVTGPDMDVRADSFWVRQSDNTGGLEGPGRLVAAMSETSPPEFPESPEKSLTGPTPSVPADNLRVDWHERVDLTFHPQVEAEAFALGDLRSAAFIGEVTVAAREFDVTAEEVGIQLPPSAEGNGAIDAISASGDVRVSGVGDAGSLACEDLDLFLTRDETGRSLPRRLVAAGHVHAENPDQSISAEDLEVTFVPRPDDDDPAAAPASEALTGTGEVMMDILKARGEVAVALPDGARILADSLDVDQSEGTMQLEGGNVSIASGRLLADRGRRIVVRRKEQLARWEGAGRARVFPEPVGEDLHQLPASDELQITWIGGVDFGLDAGPDDGNEVRIRDATFNNGVDVQAEDFWLDSDHLTFGFPAGEEDPPSSAGPEIADAIETIRAWGNVRVGGRTDRGSLSCNDLNLSLTRTDDGRSVPEEMIASGDVAASNLDRVADSGQTIWTDYLTVTFHTDDQVAENGESSETIRARVKTVVALRNVQVEMAEGGRAFADQLFGDAERDLIELRGDEVMVIRDDLIIDRATLVSLHGTDDTARWEGPGRARVFDVSIEPMGDGRVIRPSIDEIREPRLFVSWSEQMVYDNAFNDGAGALNFRGEVEAMSRPSPLELNTMAGNALDLQFAHHGPGASDEAASALSTPLSLQQQSRRLATFIAKGDAKLESRTWLHADHHDTPDVFHIAGQYVQYDALTSQARVVGDGTLLLRNAAAEPGDIDLTDDATAQAGPIHAPFSSKGLTRFRWNRELKLTRTVDDRFDLFLTGDVRAEHQMPNGDVSTLRAERVDAVVTRDEDSAASASAGSADGADLFQLGGPVAFQRVAASGGVSIITPTRDVRCDSFDYNLLTNLAEISAADERRVSILTRGTSRPIQAQHVLWYMAEDTIVITRGLASGSR